MNLVSFEMFANAIGPGHQVANVGGAFEREQPPGLLTPEPPAFKHALSQAADAGVITSVN